MVFQLNGGKALGVEGLHTKNVMYREDTKNVMYSVYLSMNNRQPCMCMQNVLTWHIE